MTLEVKICDKAFGSTVRGSVPALLQIMPAGASLKSKKGKKQETLKSDLAHILGYTGTDMDPVGPPSPVGSEKEAAGMRPCSLPCHTYGQWVADSADHP